MNKIETVIKWLLQPENQKLLDAEAFDELYRFVGKRMASGEGLITILTAVLVKMVGSVDGLLNKLSIIPHGFANSGVDSSVDISLGVVTVPDNITSIGVYAFSNCSSLKGVVISNSVTRIGHGAFENCTSLKSVVIGENVTTIDSSAFYQCTALESVAVGNGIEAIGSYAFYGCTSLESITIPDSVTSIGCSAFCDCEKLMDICYKGTTDRFKRISIKGGAIAENVTIHCTDKEILAGEL